MAGDGRMPARNYTGGFSPVTTRKSRCQRLLV